MGVKESQMMYARFVSILCTGLLLCGVAYAGTYTTDFNFGDQTLAKEALGGPGATVLAPGVCFVNGGAGLTLAIQSEDLVISHTDNHAFPEWGILRILPAAPATTFASGATGEVTVAGSTIEAIRDGTVVGPVVGIAAMNDNNNPILYAAAVRRPAGSDAFNFFGIDPGSAGVGYYVALQVGGSGNAVLGVTPIPAGTLSDVVFKIVLDGSANASFYVNGAPLAEGVATGAPQVAVIGAVSQQWGLLTADNPPYSATFKSFTVTGNEVPGPPTPPPPGAPVAGMIGLGVVAVACVAHGALVIRRKK